MFPHVEINRQLVVVGLISNTADVVVLVIVRPYQLTIGLTGEHVLCRGAGAAMCIVHSTSTQIYRSIMHDLRARRRETDRVAVLL